MTNVLAVVLMFGVLIAAAVYVPRFLLRKAVRNVVSLFRRRGATSPTSATTLEQLGLVQKRGLEKVGRLRDYRPYALSLLTQANIIRATEGGTLYLSEETLEHSPVKGFAGIK
jgi:hypothetical protein